MRPIWKGMLSFGLINVPVALYGATKKKTISFNQLRKSDYSRISYKKVGADGQEVQQSELVKGYEVSPDRYVVLDDYELDAITPAASRVIEINDFVKLDQIDPRHYDSSYYLVPESGAQKAYALLLQSMSEANVVGVAKFVLRSKEYLAAIRPAEGALTLSTMLFADEIVKSAELETYLPGDVKLTDKELNMARQLINSLVTEFEPEKYENEYYKSWTVKSFQKK
jgi:DNA end-binding protein Ku